VINCLQLDYTPLKTFVNKKYDTNYKKVRKITYPLVLLMIKNPGAEATPGYGANGRGYQTQLRPWRAGHFGSEDSLRGRIF